MKHPNHSRSDAENHTPHLFIFFTQIQDLEAARARMALIAKRETPTSSEEVVDENQIKLESKEAVEERKKKREEKTAQFLKDIEEEKEQRRIQTQGVLAFQKYLEQSTVVEGKILELLQNLINKQ